jgi:hypothetical protein
VDAMIELSKECFIRNHPGNEAMKRESAKTERKYKIRN